MEYVLKIKEYVSGHKKEIIMKGGICLIVIILVGLIYYFNILTAKSSVISEEKPKEVELGKEVLKKEIIEKYYLVDIKGFVSKPGVYSLKEGSRVIDVIRLAGGLLHNANTSVINLSLKIFDEMVIIIYSDEEVKNFKTTKLEETKVIDNCLNNEQEIVNDGCLNKDEIKDNNTNDKININTATKELLMTLSGIGESKAINIINYRKEKLFIKIEDLKEVSGIGDLIFAKIKDFITI
ncbi:MAG: helix-hairpin-helix domain-containing protein [Bacilli bacterium]